MLNLVSQEISRVFLNIFNNCLYAVMEKFSGDNNYKPEMTVKTQLLNDHVRITIRDNGPGIPANILENIFQPFFTTKPSGEGTGLGLSISHDIVKAHAGTLSAGNQPSNGAEFIITLPIK